MSQTRGATEPEPIVIQRDMSAAVYFSLQPSRQPQNLIDGLLYIAPQPTSAHEEVEQALLAALSEASSEVGGRALRRPFNCELNESTVVQPDLAYVVPARANLVGRYLRGAPDLAIEVVSPGTRAFDTEAKFTAYGKNGVREAWFVDLELATVTVVRGDGDAWKHEQVVPFGEPIPSDFLGVGTGGLSPRAG